MSIVEIENAIKDLPPEGVNELMEWFVAFHAEVWAQAHLGGFGNRPT
jgi:hypothetical protein